MLTVKKFSIAHMTTLSIILLQHFKLLLDTDIFYTKLIERKNKTHISGPAPFSSIFFSRAASYFVFENEYCSMKASKINATKILREKRLTLFQNVIEYNFPKYQYINTYS